jgi:hypothetical protein
MPAPRSTRLVIPSEATGLPLPQSLGLVSKQNALVSQRETPREPFCNKLLVTNHIFSFSIALQYELKLYGH